ncbi:Fanconi anemia group J protein homolog [Odontomachus brunneus]|uniref:Fanconi anemia group J protein homolog n=1 Tax=Odontomachus brunneus TaxID=486640 RepID=UPI0013F21800|nr:Fanconi anemia group J protein homolog [Odontomachus brunneus]
MVYIIVAIIAFFIGLLIKVSIDEWLADLSMKRLSLKRNRKNDTSEVVEISDDDESFDALSSAKTFTENNKCTAETSNVSNNLIYPCSSNFVHDSSSDDDIIEETPDTSKGNHAMFYWNKNLIKPRYQSHMPQYQNISKSDNSLDSGLTASHMESDNNDHNNLATLGDTEKEAPPPQVTANDDEIMIAGVKVKFPIKPYPCQKAVMSKLISGCTKEENCLIESPTGSGKTLALLCGVLGWQEQYRENIHKNNAEYDNAMDIENCCGADGDASFNLSPNDKSYDKISSKATQRMPKIFYCTRTHNQIGQIVKELKTTAYKHKRMTILSSRTYTCIQDTNKNKDELCHELLDPKKSNRCPYYNEKNKKDMATFEAINCLGLETPWDIEDLISLGKLYQACPYYAAKSLMSDAEIIMCPYNYIIDPKIRASMQINLKGHIVILDEAHNIEDICREVASVDIKDIKLMIASKECKELSILPDADKNTYITIYTYLCDVGNFLKNLDVNLNPENRQYHGMISKQWSGVEFLEMLDIDHIGISRFPNFLAASNAAIQDYNESRETHSRRIIPTITVETKKILEELRFALETIRDYVHDYRVYVVETEEYKTANMKVCEDVWVPTRNKHQRVRILKLVCMNPAVVFVPMARTVRSVILASGTLTPIMSFESELGIQFPHKLHANHIIPREQVYVRCIPRGPGGELLIGNYQNINTWTFKDELGNLVLQVCDAVPYGILCFFSSYESMKNILDRWKSTGTWAKLAEIKEIFVESREKKELPELMRQYREVIQESLSYSFRERCGAIMFAVFRGKVAEGTDFKDNEARCVLTIGIPYKNMKDKNVLMKKEYNDSNVSKGLLSGLDWYNINAFRTLNQALGRCIRHINDWGAILMVESRLQKPEYKEKLPKWIKEMWREDTKDYNLQVELENFVARQAARESGKEYVHEKGLKDYKI